MYALNILERITGAGNELLVYLQGQDVCLGLGEENTGRTAGDIPDSRSATLARGIVCSDPNNYYSG